MKCKKKKKNVLGREKERKKRTGERKVGRKGKEKKNERKKEIETYQERGGVMRKKNYPKTESEQERIKNKVR